MAKDVVEQIMAIEAEADRIVEQGRRRAAELDGSISEKVASVLKQREELFEREMSSFRDQLEQETAAQEEQIEQRARQVAKRLDSLDAGALARAVDLILERLRGE